MKRIIIIIFTLFFSILSYSQPNGNGNGNPNGGGKGGKCDNPPCGGPNQPVPMQTGLLAIIGGAVGFIILYKHRKSNSFK